jgi:hypothetical protein
MLARVASPVTSRSPSTYTMVEPLPLARRFARAVVAAELVALSSAEPAEAIRRIVAKLHAGLGRVVGTAGSDVIVLRALALARRAEPALSKVRVEPAGRVTGFEGHDRASVERAATVWLSEVFEVVAALIGEDLTMRIARSVWPEVKETHE